jgi:hypothetical protein
LDAELLCTNTFGVDNVTKKIQDLLKDKTVWVLGVAIFAAFIFLTTGDIKMSVLIFDAEGTQTAREDFEILHSTQTIQSLFAVETRLDLIAQAMEPIDPENQAVFKARIDNPFPGDANLLQIAVTKNGKEISKDTFSQTIANSYLYTTDAINLVGKDAERNSIVIQATIEYEGERRNQFFEYHYLSLTTCERDTDCEDPAQKCDLGNQARFSSSKERYCAWTCISHEQCKENQVCIKGFCGY